MPLECHQKKNKFNVILCYPNYSLEDTKLIKDTSSFFIVFLKNTCLVFHIFLRMFKKYLSKNVPPTTTDIITNSF